MAEAFAATPREDFLPADQRRRAAYDGPLPLGHGQTSSQPSTVESMLRLVGFLATAVPAVLGLKVLLGDADWVDTLRWVLLVVLIVGAGAFGWVQYTRQIREP